MKLPSVEEVNEWSSEKYANTLRHIPEHPDYNSNFRQLIHVAYKVAAELGTQYTDALKKTRYGYRQVRGRKYLRQTPEKAF